MKSHIAYRLAAVLGVASSALAIEPPGAAAPIPPQATPEKAAAVPLEIPEVAPANPAAAPRAYLGVGCSEVPDLLGEHLNLDPGQGILVRLLDAAGPAAKAGIARNDVITKVAGSAVNSHEQLRDLIGGLKPDEAVEVEYIHRGDLKTGRVELSTAPAQPADLAGAEVQPMEQLLLDGMPQDQARRIQDLIQDNLKAFEGLEGLEGFQGMQAGDAMAARRLLGDELQKRMQLMLQEAGDADELPDGIHLRSSGTLRMLEPDGSGVEVRSQDGGKEIRILGKGGQVEWEGPYDTPQDKEAVPAELRERIERLNIDMDFKGNGLRLRMMPDQAPAGE